MHHGNDIPGDEIPEGRPRLKLKKRTKPRTAGGSTAASSSIFGQARTREEILASKGIDSSALEKRIAAKTQRLPRMSKDEEETYDAIVQEIAFCNSEIEKAETEEAKAKAQEELVTKEAQLKAHVDAIRKAVEDKLKAPKQAGRPRFERPSEREPATCCMGPLWIGAQPPRPGCSSQFRSHTHREGERHAGNRESRIQ